MCDDNDSGEKTALHETFGNKLPQWFLPDAYPLFFDTGIKTAGFPCSQQDEC